jgi:hypothetical protein
MTGHEYLHGHAGNPGLLEIIEGHIKIRTGESTDAQKFLRRRIVGGRLAPPKPNESTYLLNFYARGRRAGEFQLPPPAMGGRANSVLP